jgi:hypothetical protein
MRRIAILTFAALAVGLAVSALPAFAQDIRGVSFRATEAMPPGTERGTADILATDGQYDVHADFSRVSNDLHLDDFENAKAWVVWAVNVNGDEINAGALNADLVLESAMVDFLPAGLILSAETSANVASRSGEALFRVTLRTVSQSSDATATTAATAPATEAAPDASPTPKATEAPAAKPGDLPTTGGSVPDVLVLLLVAAVLVAGGWQLRRVRL